MCPKCKVGTLSPTSLTSTYWRCNYCGYTENRPNPSINTHDNKQSLNDALSDFHRASDNMRKATNEMHRRAEDFVGEDKEKGGGCLTIIIGVIILYLLFGK